MPQTSDRTRMIDRFPATATGRSAIRTPVPRLPISTAALCAGVCDHRLVAAKTGSPLLVTKPSAKRKLVTTLPLSTYPHDSHIEDLLLDEK